MTWVEKLAAMHVELDNARAHDGEPAATDEEVIKHVVYDAIMDFIEHDEFRFIEDVVVEDFDIDHAVNEWLDARG